MGKKNKNKTGCEDNISDLKQPNKKRQHLNNGASSADIDEVLKEKINKKNKSNVAIDAKQDSDVESKQTNKIYKHLDGINNADVNLESGSTKVKRKKKHKNTNADDAVPKNKKILFKDDGQVENRPQNPKNDNNGKQKQFLSGEEAAVTEEEIDRFCDELNEEDNVQFDSWVKLIEEKLHPHRKNKTT